MSSSVMESDRERWRSGVAAVLAKSLRREVADLPEEPERLLDSPTYDGFPVRPLYTSLDDIPNPRSRVSGLSSGAVTRAANWSGWASHDVLVEER